jgi:V-type H+-transporting ATPase subunit C
VFVEGVSHKIRRQIEDLERAGGVESGTLTVDGVPVDTYLTRSAANYTAQPIG